MGVTTQIKVGILTVSDRGFKGIYVDDSGPALRAAIETHGWTPTKAALVPDERAQITRTFMEWSDVLNLELILSTGGTGLGPRDVTPEATRAVLDKELPGFAELMRMKGLEHTPFSALSRAVAGVRKETLIINLPGSPRGAVESLEAIQHLIPHAVRTIRGDGH
jgi:molybdenum cofactor synthesis domain-containing protein